MRPCDVVIEPLAGLEQLAALETDANTDGRAIVSRLVREWLDGRNRFSGAGERAYVAKLGGRVCGVGGLNRDPFAGNVAVGRVRRLYVAVDHRRKGIGTAIVERLMADARGVYTRLHLRTHDPHAAAFYEANGFERVMGDPDCTHRRSVVI